MSMLGSQLLQLWKELRTKHKQLNTKGFNGMTGPPGTAGPKGEFGPPGKTFVAIFTQFLIAR